MTGSPVVALLLFQRANQMSSGWWNAESPSRETRVAFIVLELV